MPQKRIKGFGRAGFQGSFPGTPSSPDIGFRNSPGRKDPGATVPLSSRPGRRVGQYRKAGLTPPQPMGQVKKQAKMDAIQGKIAPEKPVALWKKYQRHASAWGRLYDKKKARRLRGMMRQRAETSVKTAQDFGG